MARLTFARLIACARWAVLACAPGCSFAAFGGGQSGDGSAESQGTTPQPATTTTAADESTTSSGGGISGLPPTTAPDDDTASTSTTDDTTTGSSSSESGELVLVERGLLTRYYLDEDVSSGAVAEVLDAAPDPLDLPITYAGTNPEHVVVDGNSGLSWDNVGLDGGAGLPYAGTKLMTALDGASAATIEIVADITAITTDSSRLSHFGNNMEGGTLTIASQDPNQLTFRTAFGTPTARWNIDLQASGRTQYTIVFDSDAAEADRAALYLNGSQLDPAVLATIPEGAQLSFHSNGSYVLGNRAIGGRSFRGVLYYSALYSAALTAAEVKHNAEILLANDDTP